MLPQESDISFRRRRPSFCPYRKKAKNRLRGETFRERVFPLKNSPFRATERGLRAPLETPGFGGARWSRPTFPTAAAPAKRVRGRRCGNVSKIRRFLHRHAGCFQRGARKHPSLVRLFSMLFCTFRKAWPRRSAQHLPRRRRNLPKRNPTTTVVGFLFGAAYEARTRYLHLGKVALYRMS